MRPTHQPRQLTNLIATIIKFLVLDGLAFRGVRSAFYQENWAAHFNTERLCNDRVGGHGFQPVFRFHQRRIVTLFK